MTTASAITAGAWVRFPSWDKWRYVQACRHVPLDNREPRSTGYVHYDAADSPTGRFNFGGHAEHHWPCLVVTVTPEAVTA